MSKKVWKSCKRFRTCFGMTAVKSLGMAMCVFVMLNSFQHLFAQAKTTNGNAQSSISMPEMPSVSMPSVGSGFYTPGRSDFYNPNLNRRQTSSQNTTSASSAQDSASQTASSSSSSTQTQAVTNAQNLNKIANSATSSLNQLTADDISSLSNLGVFSQVSSLLGKGNASLLNQNTVSAQTADSETLKAILSELTSLKNQMSAQEGEHTAASLSDRANAEHSFSNIAKKEPKILRFNVNGYDLLATCKKIYFSELETDGTFLLTGDRKYMSENKARSETFYFYFRAKRTENGITKYSVTPAVSQDYENEYSYLYQLTQKSELTADRTGNLVTLRIGDNNWKMDLLISLDK